VADQLASDLRALVPPEELGSMHASLLAIARRIRQNLEEIDQADGPGSAPIVTALLGDVRNEVASFRATVGQAGDLSLQGGLGVRIEDLDAEAATIARGLADLRDTYGIQGLTVPTRS
jgi:hypothetical protein